MESRPDQRDNGNAAWSRQADRGQLPTSWIRPRSERPLALVCTHVYACADAFRDRRNGPRSPATAAELMAECAFFDLRKASRAVSRLYDEFMRARASPGRSSRCFALIRVEKELSVTTLGRYMVMDRTSVRRAVDPLERDGFVEVRPGDDQRVRFVRLTRKGHETVERAEPGWRRAQEALMDAIGPDRWLSIADAAAGDDQQGAPQGRRQARRKAALRRRAAGTRERGRAGWWMARRRP